MDLSGHLKISIYIKNPIFLSAANEISLCVTTFVCNPRVSSFIKKISMKTILKCNPHQSASEPQKTVKLPAPKGHINIPASARHSYRAGRPFSLSCMRAMAPPVKSLRTCTVSLWSCSDSRTNSCWVSASCCTDSDNSSRERETVSNRMLVVCCSWTLSDTFCSMTSLVFCEDDTKGLENVCGGPGFWTPLFPLWFSVCFTDWVYGSTSTFWSSSESPNTASASWFAEKQRNKLIKVFWSIHHNCTMNTYASLIIIVLFKQWHPSVCDTAVIINLEVSVIPNQRYKNLLIANFTFHFFCNTAPVCKKKNPYYPFNRIHLQQGHIYHHQMTPGKAISSKKDLTMIWLDCKVVAIQHNVNSWMDFFFSLPSQHNSASLSMWGVCFFLLEGFYGQKNSICAVEYVN